MFQAHHLPLFQELIGVDISTLSARESWKLDLNIQALMAAPKATLFHPLHI